MKTIGFKVVLAVLLFLPCAVVGQTQDPPKPATEVDQLKQRLQQLEQTVLELKGQIDAIETKKKDPAPAIVTATYSEPTAAPPETAKPEEPA